MNASRHGITASVHRCKASAHPTVAAVASATVNTRPRHDMMVTGNSGARPDHAPNAASPTPARRRKTPAAPRPRKTSPEKQHALHRHRHQPDRKRPERAPDHQPHAHDAEHEVDLVEPRSADESAPQMLRRNSIMAGDLASFHLRHERLERLARDVCRAPQRGQRISIFGSPPNSPADPPSWRAQHLDHPLLVAAAMPGWIPVAPAARASRSAQGRARCPR